MIHYEAVSSNSPLRLCSLVHCSGGTVCGWLAAYPPVGFSVHMPDSGSLLLCSATQCILINCDEDDFGVSVTFRTSQEIQCLPYEGIFFRDLFHETTYLLLKNKYGDLLNLSYIHIYFIC